jgi:Tol biopolymer transport system component
MVSLNSRGRASNAWSWMPSLSPNGRYVAFCSTASNLVRPDRRPRVPHTGPGLDPHTDVFVRDLRRGVKRRASSDRRGRMANAGSCFPSVADNGDVAFVSEATDLVRGYRNRFIETFVWDWSSRRVRAVAAPPGGGPGPGSEGAAISPDGRYVEFYTGGRLAASDTDVLGDAYLYDRRRGSAQVVSPGPLDCFHGGILGLTPHARHVLHWCGDMVRVLDRSSGRVVNATPTLDGRPPNSTVTDAGISADGRAVVFCASGATSRVHSTASASGRTPGSAIPAPSPRSPTQAPACARPTCPPTGGRLSSPPTCRGSCRTTFATCARPTPSSRRCPDAARPGQRRHIADTGLLAQRPLGIDRRSRRGRLEPRARPPSAPTRRRRARPRAARACAVR